MEQLAQKHARNLEFPKVLEMLAKHCSCPDANERAKNLQPLNSLDSVKELMNETVAAYKLVAQFGSPSFGGISGVSSQIARAASGGTLSTGELLNVAAVLHIIRTLGEWRLRHCTDTKTVLDRYFEALMPNKYLEDKIYSAIISEEEISDHASPELNNIRRKIRAASSRVREQLDKVIRSKTMQKFLQEPIVTIRDGRFVVPVRAENRSDVPGLVHDTSSTGSTVFVEPMSVVEANNEIKVLSSKEKEEISRILAELSAEAGGFAGSINVSYEAVISLDLIFSKAKFAFGIKASEPEINSDGIIDLHKARHPLLDPKKVVATDIRLGGEFDTLVITGPNTGGKTVSLKTIGLLTLMAECGLMLPVNDNSKISVFDNVLADIGDEQSIEQSLSTFSAHMTNMIEIFKIVDSYSLVLLDELGAGTDPAEGAALATAIIEELRSRGAKVAATTHYSELKAYAIETKGVENASCEFDVSTLSPTYRLLIGLPGRSNAFAILQKLGMDNAIIDNARKLVSSDNNRFEQVVETLQQSHEGLENERLEAYRLRREAEELAKKSREEREKLKREKEKIIETARGEAKRISAAARAESDRLIYELEEIKKQSKTDNAAEMLRRAKAAAKSGMNKVENAADPLEEAHKSAYKLPRPLKPGDDVTIVDIDKNGVVVTPPDSSGNCYIQAGIIKTKINVSNLRLLENKPKSSFSGKKERTVRGVESRALRSVSTEKDIRGMASDEGIMELDAFIDEAVMTGIETITVIHGKGTGVLRDAVRKYLRTNRSVKEFRRGMYGEGEDGVTVVTLK